MTDKVIIRIAEETTRWLKRALPGDSTPSVVPSYNALLAAAKENHPEDTFLANLEPIEKVESAVDLAILYSQLRIAIEAMNPDAAQSE